MALYTILDKIAIDTVLENHNIAPAKAFKVLSGGSENTNYFIASNDGKFVLTICENKTFEHSQSLATLLEHLEKNGFSTSKVVKNRQNKSILQLNKKPAMLKWFLDGDVLENFNLEILEKLGQQIARLHKVKPLEYLPDTPSYGLSAFHEVIDANIVPDFSAWLTDTKQYIEDNISAQLPKALIHSDIFCNNVIVMEDNSPIIMDFEEACYYYRIYDLGMAIVGTCQEGEGVSFVKAKSLLKGYEKEIPLSPVEKERLPAFIVHAAAATAFWRFRQYRIRNPEEQFKNHYLEMKNIADFVRYTDSRMFILNI